MKYDVEYPESPRAIARRLRSLRAALGLSQTKMAQLLGAGPTAALWGNYQSNNPKVWKRISVDNAIRLCEATGVTLDWIYRGDVRLLPQELWQKIIAAEVAANQAVGH